MLRSKRIGLFVAVLLCLACGMLFLRSQGRAQQNAAVREHLVSLGSALQANPYPNLVRVNDPMAQAANAPQVNLLSEYWIGVDGSPADDVLRAQLGLPAGQGVIVNQVVANSPAEKAGLKQYDALLAADDKPINQISDLASHVKERKETTITLKLIRSAKPLTIEVTPQRRPATQTGETCPQMSPLDDPEFVKRVYLDVLGVVPTTEEQNVFLHDLRDDKRARLANELLRRSTIATKSCTYCHHNIQPTVVSDLHRWVAGYDITARPVTPGQSANLVDLDNDGWLDLYIANGALAVTAHAPPPLPDDLTITITRKGKEPARVQVTRGDQSWGTTENKVNELPEDIRGFASQYFATPRAVAVQPAVTYHDLQAQNYDRLLNNYKLARVKASQDTALSAATGSDTEKPASQTAPALADVEKQLKMLTQQLEQLQRTLEELRKSSAVPPAKPDGEPQP